MGCVSTKKSSEFTSDASSTPAPIPETSMTSTSTYTKANSPKSDKDDSDWQPRIDSDVYRDRT